ncbi:MAG: inositol monophosphatase family protein, partial [Gemmatimonadota bacterium]
PARAHVAWATAGAGAFAAERWTGTVPPAGRAVGLRACSPESGRVLLASRSEVRAGEFEPFRAAWSLEEVGSTAWKLARSAMGAGAYISRGPKSEWDVAAGVLLVVEAGGVATDLEGRPVALNRRDPSVHGVVAGCPEAHARLLARARPLPAPRLQRERTEG